MDLSSRFADGITNYLPPWYDIYPSDTITIHTLGGVPHCVDGPAIITQDRIEYRLQGKLHRLDGPAVETNKGDKFYYLNGMLHRIDGAAVEAADGHREYYQHNLRHRDNGPAIEYINGDVAYYRQGHLYDPNIITPTITTPIIPVKFKPSAPKKNIFERFIDWL